MATHADLAFFHAHDVLEAEQDGIRRARSFDPDALHADEVFDLRRCAIEDCSQPSIEEPQLLREGFGAIDLGHARGLGPVLEAVRDAGAITSPDAKS